MQRSRRVLLQRRAVALEKTKNVEEEQKQKLYRVSLSAVVLLWVLIFLLNSLISHGNGYRDEQYAALAESISEKEEKLNVIDSTPNIDTESTNTQGEKCENDPAFSEIENYQNTLLPEDDNKSPSPEPILLKSKLPANEPETIPEKETKKRDNEVEIKAEEGEIRDETKEVKTGIQVEEKETKNIEESETKDQKVEEDDRETKEEEKEMNGQKAERIHRITPLPLDEFKNKAINSKGKTNPSQTGTSGRVVRRVEPGGKEYNYASQSKGAKVLAFNKEAKGASNILDKDKDKYLRNPCSAEGKFVIIELSEETLVDMIVIANFEHYSSNLKQFEVFSSLVYPTDKWDYIGEFVAPNSKHGQRFNLTEPRWARYLKFNFLSHYGSEFYCTLSLIEVYGVDAVERMLETLISDEKSKTVENVEDVNETVPSPPQEHVEKDEPSKGINNFDDSENDHGSENKKEPAPDPSGKPSSDPIIKSVPDPVTEARALQVGRIAGDTVLKVLMQKVQGLDLNFSVLERYLEELNNRYGQIFKDFDADMANFDLLLDKLKAEIKGLQASRETIVNELGDITDWKLLVSKQMEKYLVDTDILRSEVEKVKERQLEMENKGLAVIFVIFVFWSLAIAKLLSGIIARVCKSTVTDDEKFCRPNTAWFLLLLSSSIVAFILFI